MPHVDFAVQPAWIWNLLAGGKMRPQAARLEFVRQARDLPRILACLDKCVQEVAAAAFAASMMKVPAELSAARVFVLRGSITSRFRTHRRSFSAPKKRPHFEVHFPAPNKAPKV